MSQPSDPRQSRPPHNPGLRELVDGKRRWSLPQNPSPAGKTFRGWHERGYLPHRDEPGLTQFVTFRLADSFPAALRSEWKHLLAIEDDRERRKQLEGYLDKGHGECHLKNPEIAKIIEKGLLMFEGDRYQLGAWVIMPNHVHVMFRHGSSSMVQKTVESWKKHTARLANQRLGKRGAFWDQDYYDTYMRNAGHALKTRQYIENNPTKVGLVLDHKNWTWSSARFRDPIGNLTVCRGGPTCPDRGCVGLPDQRQTRMPCPGVRQSFWIIRLLQNCLRHGSPWQARSRPVTERGCVGLAVPKHR